MVTVDIYLMLFALSFLFYRAAQASAREEEAERARSPQGLPAS